jgi:hypothetical protein
MNTNLKLTSFPGLFLNQPANNSMPILPTSEETLPNITDVTKTGLSQPFTELAFLKPDEKQATCKLTLTK